MSAKTQRPGRRGSENTPVATDTLQMLGVVLKAAFRMHCTGETVCGKNAWQIVNEVQRKLADLSQGQGALVSEERLAEYVEKELTAVGPKLAEAA